MSSVYRYIYAHIQYVQGDSERLTQLKINGASTHARQLVAVYIYIYIYVCLSVSVSLSV